MAKWEGKGLQNLYRRFGEPRRNAGFGSASSDDRAPEVLPQSVTPPENAAFSAGGYEQLKLLIAKLRRMQFGRSSEKLVELPKGTLRIGGSVLGGQGHFGPKGSN